MTNPWYCNDAAFEVMFSDTAEIKTKTERGTVKCCVFPIEDVDPFIDTDTETKIKRISILLKKKNWFCGTRPSIGDRITLPNGEQFKLSEINDEQNWYKMTARSI